MIRGMNDTFCIYCQEEYGTNEKLVAHIKKAHKNTYAYHSIAMKGKS